MSQQLQQAQLSSLIRKYLQSDDPWWKSAIDEIIDSIDSNPRLEDRYDFSIVEQYVYCLDVTQLAKYHRTFRSMDRAQSQSRSAMTSDVDYWDLIKSHK